MFVHFIKYLPKKDIMASMISNRILNKIQCQSFYQITKRNVGLITNSRNFYIKSDLSNKILLQKPHLNPFQVTIRPATSTLSIKEYKTSRKYTGYWKIERLLGWSLIVMIPMAFAIESKELEMALGTVALTHTYLGCQSMCSDYLRSGVVGKVVPIIVRLFIVIISLSSLAGIYQLIYKDIGIVNMIKKFWSIRGKDDVPTQTKC